MNPNTLIYILIPLYIFSAVFFVGCSQKKLGYIEIHNPSEFELHIKPNEQGIYSNFKKTAIVMPDETKDYIFSYKVKDKENSDDWFSVWM